MIKTLLKRFPTVLPWLIAITTGVGIVYLLWGATGATSYWTSFALFVIGSLLSLQSASTSNVNSLLSNFKEVIIGSVNIGLKSIQQIEDNPPAVLAENTNSKFQFIGVAGSKFLQETLGEGSFFRTNSVASNVQIMLMDPFSDELKRLSKKKGAESVHRRKIIESIKYLKSLKDDGYLFELRLYPKLPPMRLMICDGSITTMSVYSADSTGWKNAQLIFDTADSPDSMAPYFVHLYNDLWDRGLTINLDTRSESLSIFEKPIKNKSDSKPMYDLGMVHGRFQPFHHEHLEYVLWGLSNSKKCIIAITQPDITHLSETHGAVHRAKPEGNPFTFEERKKMITLSLQRLGIENDKYEIIQFDVDNMADSFQKHSLIDIKPVQFVKVYSEWEIYKKTQLNELGYQVVEINESHKEFATKNVTGTLVRELINANRNWIDYVPFGTQKVVKDSRGCER